MLEQVTQWIEHTNNEFSPQRQSCYQLMDNFADFYPTAFLDNAYFVVVDTLPKPDFPELRQLGLGAFIDMDAAGITYNNTYYLQPHVAKNLRVHFHELVHVAQWQHLGMAQFIARYMQEIQSVGYMDAPLEKMAYALDNHFSLDGAPFDVPRYVAQHLQCDNADHTKVSETLAF